MVEIDNAEFLRVIAETQKCLEDDREWEERYAGYAHQLKLNRESVAALIGQFHQWTPLQYYLCIDKINKAGKKLVIDVRYRGQSVAEMEVKTGEVRIRTNKKHIEWNKTYFDCDIALPKYVAWAGTEAAAFRKHFSGLDGKFGRIPEHNIESLLLSEFSKPAGDGKGVVYIQPVRYPEKDSGFRFAMATPLRASKPQKITYSKQYGGGIDILARTGRGTARLTVIEVKRKYQQPKTVLMQAIAYAIFILKLLRSDSGSDWWHSFGFDGKLSNSLIIKVVCAMPHTTAKRGNDTSFEKLRLPVGDDWIECHYIYFDYDSAKNSLRKFSSSLQKNDKGST